jgi:hypothetical protein
MGLIEEKIGFGFAGVYTDKRTRFGLVTLSGCGQASNDDEACYPRGRNGHRHLRNTPGWLGRAGAEKIHRGTWETLCGSVSEPKDDRE